MPGTGTGRRQAGQSSGRGAEPAAEGVGTVTIDGADDVRLIVPEGVAAPSAVPADIFAAAVDCYVSGQRLDMRALARKLGVSRATLYRRAGNRERVLEEVLWWRSRHALLDVTHRTAHLTGRARVVATVSGILRAIERDRPFRTFLEADPEAAMRILTGARSTVQQGIIGALERVIDLETKRGHFAANLDTPTLAYTIVRITEGFLYSDIIADRSTDTDRAIMVIEALLRGLDKASAARTSASRVTFATKET